jgi:membrane-associated phospholipid phosphatase
MLSLVLSALPALLAAPTSAAEAAKTSAPRRALPIGVDRRPHRLNWTYPRFRTWQYAASVVTSGVNFYIEFAGPDYPDQRTRGPVPLDSSLRSWLRIDNPRKAQRVALISDHIWYATQYFSFLDGIITPLLFDRGNFDVAWQLSMINWQGIGLSFFVTRLAHLTVGRARPSQYGCSEEPGAEFPCISAGPSFFSGHTSMSALGAGLTCSHHAALPLYGGGVPDAAVCALLVASTLTVGTMRIASDRHWASDVFVGLGIGGAIGLGLPYLLHYSANGPEPLGSRWLPRNVAVIPTFEEGRLGLAAIGSL